MSAVPLHIETPLIKSSLDDRNVYFKIESLQPTGSFKARGIGKLCQHYHAQGFKKLVSSSGGNAGVATAFAGNMLNLPTTVFMPSTSGDVYKSFIKRFDADIIIHGDVWDEAHTAAMTFAEKESAAYIHPFDDPIIWQGHSTIIEECFAAGITPDAVVVSVGGGGLACGLLQGMHQCGWNKVPLITVETLGADSFYQSVQAGKLITLDKITSRATTLGAKRVSDALFDWTNKHNIIATLTTDEIAERACARLASDHHILTELAAGAALSTVYADSDKLAAYNTVLVIVCGGVNTRFLTDY